MDPWISRRELGDRRGGNTFITALMARRSSCVFSRWAWETSLIFFANVAFWAFATEISCSSRFSAFRSLCDVPQKVWLKQTRYSRDCRLTSSNKIAGVWNTSHTAGVWNSTKWWIRYLRMNSFKFFILAELIFVVFESIRKKCACGVSAEQNS